MRTLELLLNEAQGCIDDRTLNIPFNLDDVWYDAQLDAANNITYITDENGLEVDGLNDTQLNQIKDAGAEFQRNNSLFY